MTPNVTTIFGLIFAAIAAWSFRGQLAGFVSMAVSGLKSLASKAADGALVNTATSEGRESTDDELQAYWLAIYKRLAKQGCIDGQKALTDLVLPHLTEHPPHQAAPEAV